VKVLAGYLLHGDVKRSELAGWVRDRQRARLWAKVRARLGARADTRT